MIRRANRNSNEITFSQIIQHLFLCKWCCNFCNIYLGFCLQACEFMVEKSFNFNCGTEHWHKKLWVWTAVWRAEIASCTTNCLSISPTVFTCILWCPALHSLFMVLCFHMVHTTVHMQYKIECYKVCLLIFTMFYDEWDLLLMLLLIEHFLCGMMIPMALD